MIGCILMAAPYGPAVGTEEAKGFVARLAGERGTTVASPATGAREYSDRELIATSPPGAPVRGRKRCGDPVESDG
jgi:hypothetical protein